MKSDYGISIFYPNIFPIQFFLCYIKIVGRKSRERGKSLELEFFFRIIRKILESNRKKIVGMGMEDENIFSLSLSLSSIDSYPSDWLMNFFFFVSNRNNSRETDENFPLSFSFARLETKQEMRDEGVCLVWIFSPFPKKKMFQQKKSKKMKSKNEKKKNKTSSFEYVRDDEFNFQIAKRKKKELFHLYLFSSWSSSYSFDWI